MTDIYHLERFISAQGENINTILQELKNGSKVSHWMWYVFPQIKGLGRSSAAEFYAIQNLDEAAAYLHHPLLGQRLLECTRTVNAHRDLSSEAIFGHPDYLKFRSCMTLFAQVAEGNNPFAEALTIFFDGEPDERTLSILDGSA